MKLLKTGLLLMLIFFKPLAAQEPDTVKFTTLRPAEFNLAFDVNKNALMIDVREFFEFRKSRIPGAVNIPSSGNLQISADTLDKNRPLFFYCTSGFRSRRVSKFFADNGFPDVFNLDGGITAWKNNAMETDRKKVKR
jgi:rhodanese-related sulfurtransferase